jgi:hypothetical protein
MKTRTDFRVGDKVFCFGFGNGIVDLASTDPVNDYIRVKFLLNKYSCFTMDGKRFDNEPDRCLFHGEMPVIPQEWTIVDDPPNLSDLKIDDKIMVSETGHNWLKRRFAGMSRAGMPTTFAYGADSWGSDESEPLIWAKWRLPTEEELKP